MSAHEPTDRLARPAAPGTPLPSPVGRRVILLCVLAVTRGEVLEGGHEGTEPLQGIVQREPLWIYEDASLREAADRMVTEGVGRLVVVTRADPSRPAGSSRAATCWARTAGGSRRRARPRCAGRSAGGKRSPEPAGVPIPVEISAGSRARGQW